MEPDLSENLIFDKDFSIPPLSYVVYHSDTICSVNSQPPRWCSEDSCSGGVQQRGSEVCEVRHPTLRQREQKAK